MADYQAKKAALQQRIEKLDQDAERIAEKRAVCEAGIAECDRMLAGGEAAPVAKKAKTAKRSRKRG